MSSEKKDLTRIEDLGEFIHELNSGSDFLSSEDFSADVPDLPIPQEEEQEETNFSENFEFDSSEEFPTEQSLGEETPQFLEDDQESDFHSDFGNSFDEVSKEEFSFLDEAEEKIEAMSPYETPAPESLRVDKYRAPETFEDLKKFSESSSFQVGPVEANPSFGLLIKNIRFTEDVNDILSLLKEFNLLSDSEEQTHARLMRGMLLVPRVSEFAAIYLAHKLRRFNIDIEVGLSDEIHPPKHQEKPEVGIVSKNSLYQNQSHHFSFKNLKLDASQIIISTSPTLEGHQIVRYIGVASEHKVIEGQAIEEESSQEVFQIYEELAQKLKAHALKASSNAVVGLNYQLTPIPAELGAGNKYRISCTGNLVWVNKL